METKRILIFLLLVSLLTSCYKPGDIQVQNNISNVKIVTVKWGDIYITGELLPGETSSKVTIDRIEEKLPASHKISFTMEANQKTVYLETVEEYSLAEDEGKLIILDDDTEVTNPND